MTDCAVCGNPVPGGSRGVTCGYSCRARLRESRKTIEWRKPRDYDPALVERVRHLYVEQGMTVAEVQDAIGAGVKVKTLMSRNGIQRRAAAKRHQSGEANSSWAGDDGSYQTAHNRLRASRGPASEHPCVDCGTSARDWSYDGLDVDEKRAPNGCRYSLDTNHYQPRCGSCHTALDRKRDSLGRFAGRESAA